MKEYSITKKEKLLEYEIRMFRNTCNSLNNWSNLDQFNKNLLIESLALHTRVLIDFFYGIKKHSDDIIAQDLLSNSVIWSNVGPKISEILKEAKNKAHKQAAHLSLYRLELKEKGKAGWRFNKINKEMNKTIKIFYELKQ